MSKDDREEKVAATREPDESEQRSKRARWHESAAASSSSLPRSEVPTPSSSLSSHRFSPVGVIRRHLQLLGWTVVPGTQRSRDLAHQVAQKRTRTTGAGILGNARQKELVRMPGFEAITAEWTEVVKDTAVQAGVDDVESLFVVDHKMLTAAPTQGAQAVHWDCAREEAAAEKYTCLLVCSLGHRSTALPNFAASDDLSFSNDPEKMKSVAHLLAPSMYTSQELQPGDVIIFRQSTPHFGVANTCAVGDRVLLFAVLSPSDAAGQDQEQVLPWLFIRSAFGPEAKEFAQSLVDNRVHDPILRLQRDEGRPAANEALLCLETHNMRALYY